MYFYNTLINFCDKCNTYLFARQACLTNFKYNNFNNKILHYAIYNIKTHKYKDIYSYDNILYLLYLWITGYIFCLIDIQNLSFINNDELILCTFIKNNNIYKIITDKINYNVLIQKNINNMPKFIYCILDDNDDITHYFEDFKTSIFINKNIETQCYINAIFHFNKKNICMNENSQLKLMLDDDYAEKIFKAKDILIFK
jgi:hypothetical protein